LKPIDVVIAHGSDHGALNLARHLSGSPLGRSVLLLRPETLAIARWSHALDRGGRAHTRLTLPDGLQLEGRDIGVLINRIQCLTAPRFRQASAKDRDYADMELQALVTSWLGELADRVVPSLRHHPWLIPSITHLCWAEAALEAGLPIASHHRRATGGLIRSPLHRDEDTPGASPAGNVLVAGEHFGGSLAGSFGKGCLAVARRLAFPLLLFRFEDLGAGPAVREVSLFPPLREPWEVKLVSRMVGSMATARES
jgi:hypothetical protein